MSSSTRKIKKKIKMSSSTRKIKKKIKMSSSTRKIKKKKSNSLPKNPHPTSGADLSKKVKIFVKIHLE